MDLEPVTMTFTGRNATNGLKFSTHARNIINTDLELSNTLTLMPPHGWTEINTFNLTMDLEIEQNRTISSIYIASGMEHNKQC